MAFFYKCMLSEMQKNLFNWVICRIKRPPEVKNQFLTNLFFCSSMKQYSLWKSHVKF